MCPETGNLWRGKLREEPTICVLLFAAVALVFWPVGGFDFVNYDDPDYVSANPHVQSGLNWKNLAWAFASGHASNWHPITWLSHMLDWQLFGENFGAQHLVSAAVHALNTVLVFLVLKRMTGAHWRSAIVAAFFGLHPLRAESVAWISERKDVLSAFFLQLTLWAYWRYARFDPGLAPQSSTVADGSDVDPPESQRLRSGRTVNSQFPSSLGVVKSHARPLDRATTHLGNAWNHKESLAWYGLSLSCFALGLMSKPMLVTVPFLLLLLDYWPLERIRLDSAGFKRALWLVLEKWPFFLLAGSSSVITFLVQRRGGAVSTSLSFSERLANALVSYVRYVGKTVWPERLSVLYPHPGHWPAWEVAGSGAMLLAILVAVGLEARKRPYLAVGWFWFMGALLPVIGLVQVGIQSMADRYTYIPSIGLFILAVWGLSEVVHQWPSAGPGVVTGTVVSLIACECVTAHQIQFWRNSETLFQRAIDVTSNNYLAYNNLGFYLWGRGNREQAKENYRNSIEINPAYSDALNNLGYALAGEKKYSEAIAYYEATLRSSQNHPEIHNNLGNALSELGSINQAIEQYAIVLKSQPDHADAHNNLGIALAMQGKLDEAVGHFRAAIRAKPNYASAHSNLGNAFAVQHRTSEAIAEYQESLRLDPNDAQAHNNLGNALFEQGRLDDAIQQYTQALRLNPDNPEAHFNLAVALTRTNNRTEAAAHFTEALRLNPGNAEARRQLELLSAGK